MACILDQEGHFPEMGGMAKARQSGQGLESLFRELRCRMI